MSGASREPRGAPPDEHDGRERGEEQHPSVAPLVETAPRACANCGAALAGPFCAHCGQEDRRLDPTFRELLHEVGGEVTNVDGRIARTLRTLLRPGRLTLEWIAGRRAPYLPPLRTYLIVSVVYFFVSALTPDAPIRRGAGIQVGRGGAVQVGVGRGGSTGEVVRTERDDTDSLPAFLREGLQNAARDEEGFQRRVQEHAPKLFFALVPLFGLFVALVYRNRRRRLPQHLWFALHVHAFGFVALTVAELATLTGIPTVMGLVSAVAALSVPVYLVLAMHAVYGGRWLPTLGRAAAIGALYMTAMLVASSVLLLAMLTLA